MLSPGFTGVQSAGETGNRGCPFQYQWMGSRLCVSQFAAGIARQRDYTGAGFYTTISVALVSAAHAGFSGESCASALFAGACARPSQDPASWIFLILWVRMRGFITCLEGSYRAMPGLTQVEMRAYPRPVKASGWSPAIPGARERPDPGLCQQAQSPADEHQRHGPAQSISLRRDRDDAQSTWVLILAGFIL